MIRMKFTFTILVTLSLFFGTLSTVFSKAPEARTSNLNEVIFTAVYPSFDSTNLQSFQLNRQPALSATRQQLTESTISQFWTATTRSTSTGGVLREVDVQIKQLPALNFNIYLPVVVKEPLLQPGQVVQTTFSPGGSRSRVMASDGTIVTFDLPEGAVDAPLDVTFTPLEPADDKWFSVAISPTGVLLNSPMTVTAQLPETTTLDDKGLLYFGDLNDPFLLQTNVNLQNRTLTAAIPILGIPDEQTGDKSTRRPSEDPPPTPPPPSITPTPTQPPPAPTPPPPPPPGGGGVGGNLNAESVSCQARVDATENALNSLLQRNQFTRALRLVNNTAALLQSSGCEELANEWLDHGIPIACQAYDEAVTNLNAVAIDDLNTYHDFVQPVYYWASELIEAGVYDQCPQVFDAMEVIEPKIEQYITLYQSSIDVANDHNAFYDLIEEMINHMKIYREVYRLGFSAAETDLLDQVILPLMDQLRLDAFIKCRDQGAYYALWRLTEYGFNAPRYIAGVNFSPRTRPYGMLARFSEEDIIGDMEHCGSSLNFEIQSGGEIIAEGYLGRGSTPGSQIVELDRRSPVAGTLSLDGTINTLSCWWPTPPYPVEPDQLIVKLEGFQVAQISQEEDSEQLALPHQLDIGNMLQQAGFTEEEAVGSDPLSLEIWRQSDECFGLYPVTDHKLFTINLQFE